MDTYKVFLQILCLFPGSYGTCHGAPRYPVNGIPWGSARCLVEHLMGRCGIPWYTASFPGDIKASRVIAWVTCVMPTGFRRIPWYIARPREEAIQLGRPTGFPPIPRDPARKLSSWDGLRDFPRQIPRQTTRFTVGLIREPMGRHDWHLLKRCLNNVRALFCGTGCDDSSFF